MSKLFSEQISKIGYFRFDFVNLKKSDQAN